MIATLYIAETNSTQPVSESILSLLRPRVLPEADWINRLSVDGPTAGLLLGSVPERALANSYYAVFVGSQPGHAVNAIAADHVRRLTGFSAPLYGNVLIVERVSPTVLAFQQNVARLEAELAHLCERTAQLVQQFVDEPAYELEFTEAFTLDRSGSDDAKLGRGLEKSEKYGVQLIDDHNCYQPLDACTIDELLTILEKLENGHYTIK